ncbi:hypothetical protein K1719_018600 [Acacia pycnantha]|nr:hypothetical protein K1719_018600 [Acacia pycnantha]
MEDPNYADEHPFVAVEFDTKPNRKDPPYDHVGINVKQMWTPYTTQWYTMNDGRKYDTEITYDSSSFQLSVKFTGYKDNVKIRQNYSHQIDLNEYLPEQVQFGFSSATGLQFELHTLCSCSIVGKKKDDDRLDLYLDKDFESVGPKKFSYNELVRATNNFLEDHMLGEGGFGGVYKGFMRDLNSYIANKKISQESRQGVREYAFEVKIISQLRHKNLVQLMGWGHKKNDLLLIYEFMPNGS